MKTRSHLEPAPSFRDRQSWKVLISFTRIFSLLSAILHLGNIRYKKKTYRDDSIDICNPEVLPIVSELLEVSSVMVELAQWLMWPKKGNQIVNFIISGFSYERIITCMACGGHVQVYTRGMLYSVEILYLECGGLSIPQRSLWWHWELRAASAPKEPSDHPALQQSMFVFGLFPELLC